MKTIRRTAVLAVVIFLAVLAHGPTASATTGSWQTPAPHGIYNFGTDDPCASSDWTYNNSRWPGGVYTYYTYTDSGWPSGTHGRNQVALGHLNWTYTTDACGQPDISPFVAAWGGQSCCYGTPSYENVSFRAMGGFPVAATPDYPIPCNGLVAACAWNKGPGTYTNGFYDVTDSDIRFNWAMQWWTGNPNYANQGLQPFLDLQGVATHEAGHSLGLGDLYAPVEEDLSMFGRMPFDSRHRTLGWGDYTGMQVIYP